jgi:AraC family transcriptional regulator of adaptative response/methylated-DNA-[protein]-cysteine methyltransferase
MSPRTPDTIVADACRLIEGSATMPDLGTLARAAGLSPSHFHRTFKAATGVTPKAYAAAFRAKRMQSALRENPSVTGAMYQAGFQSSGRFYADAPKTLGMTPTTYQAGGKGMTIRFAIGQSSLGAILVAATDIGICAIMMGDDPEALARDLQRRFSRAEIIGADTGFERYIAAVAGLVERPGEGLDLPLDIRGTAFQQRVWQALRKIPAGETASYADIARMIGHPAAMRAVAQACGANHIALAIPCHRVIRTDGALSGYRWGVERKEALLERERKKR